MRRERIRWGAAAALLALIAAACGTAAAPLPAPGPTPSEAPTALATATATPVPTPTPAPTPLPCTNSQVVPTWTLARRAAQLVVVPAVETAVGAAAPSVRLGAAGIVLFGPSAPGDLGRQLAALAAQAPPGAPPAVMTDEEGGEVQRMANLVGSIPWPATMAATMTPGAVRQLLTQVGARMAANGITMDLAPVLDLATGPGPDAIHVDGPRSFGLSPATATSFGLAFARGLEAGGVIPVVKHFPGEGSATSNTDDGPASLPPLSTLMGADLLPFEAAIRAGMPAVMVGDASIPGLSTIPASLSATVVTGLLRHRLGFRGLVLTDALSAGAIGALGLGVPEAAVDAVGAGADLVLYNQTDAGPNATFSQTVAALVAAVTSGRIPVAQLDASVVRVLNAKRVSLCP